MEQLKIISTAKNTEHLDSATIERIVNAMNLFDIIEMFTNIHTRKEP